LTPAATTHHLQAAFVTSADASTMAASPWLWWELNAVVLKVPVVDGEIPASVLAEMRSLDLKVKRLSSGLYMLTTTKGHFQVTSPLLGETLC